MRVGFDQSDRTGTLGLANMMGSARTVVRCSVLVLGSLGIESRGLGIDGLSWGILR